MVAILIILLLIKPIALDSASGLVLVTSGLSNRPSAGAEAGKAEMKIWAAHLRETWVTLGNRAVSW